VIDAPPQLVPRLRNWVASDYPGTKIAITEYNWGAVDDITGAIAEADILGIFGREGLDLGTMWSPPTQTQPAANAFRMYLNYDGLGGHFGSTSVSATTGDPDQLSIFAAQRSDQALTVMVLNKATSDLASSVPLANFTAAGTANVFTYSAANLGAIAHGSDIAVDPVAGVSYTFPARSITLFVIPAAADPTIPQPVISSIVNAASGVGAQVAPGEMITITGANFATSVDQIEIRFNGSLAPVLNVSADGTTINAVVPYRAALTPNVWVWVESNGVRSAGMSIPVVQTLPGIFWIADAYGAVINRDTPASAGDVVSIIATGEGVTNPPGVDGRMAVNVLPQPVAACTASIGGSAAQVFYCGASPGDVTGRLRVDVQVPSGLRAGDHPVVLTIGSASSRGSVLLPVR
jgi:uncharacterized protein (TIGR03437 family)